MSAYLLPSAAMVEAIHDAVLNPGELAGRARDKSLEGALARVENRLAYGLVEDVVGLAAAYAMAIAQGHCFNDANKRTAYRVLIVVLDMNGAPVPVVAEDIIGQKIIALAQGKIDDGALADWLRERT
ncbi:type II toxin-antitoxin system death-on-curing family toxin [Paracoccus sanguinis]|uniref:Death on curing protein n=1 Tax=Paracoccus sanguinis TaxID=1545044 RepID=A0A1H2RH95_9RHOB|nr:type II toxin-antitoxin system death-on-curing family toxin [Paracoccus sanguinis]KGJ17363.1 death-on-curing protein [Paracoccus sanguinis]SDW18757.1 death on curing protein [Paracoccus sanguinis]